jgi:hypothetical protein
MLPSKFFDLLLCSASVNGQYSLGRFCGEAALTHDVSITKQAFDARFNDAAVTFVKGVLEELITKQMEVPIDSRFLEKFKRVLVKDSTRFDLPKRLKEHFAGFGGKITSEAGASIQYEFDLKTGKLHDLEIASATKTDFQDAKEKTDEIEKGDLIIRDLGYFSSIVINTIIKKEAFFLSRLKSKMIVFDEQLVEVSFKEMFGKMSGKKQTRDHINATIGEKEQIPVRLLIEMVPEEVYQERIRRREAENKKKGHKTTEEYKARARFNLMITNISEDDLPAENIYKLYKTRWQIELLFKTWKSTIGIHNIHPMKYQRLMCLLYAKLILYIVNSQVTGLFARRLYEKQNKLLSYDKSLKTLNIYFMKTREMLTTHRFRLTIYIQEINKLLSKNHWLEKRKNKVGLNEIFNLFICISDN